MRNYKEIATGSEIRKMYEFEERNSKGEKITVEISECEAGKQQLKMGFPEHWLGVRAYAEKENGDCSGKYNPFQKNHMVIIESLLTVSDENKKKVLEMVEKLAFA